MWDTVAGPPESVVLSVAMVRRLVYAILNEDMGLNPSKDGLDQLRERESDVDAVIVRLVGGPGGTTGGAVDMTQRVKGGDNFVYTSNTLQIQ